MGFLDRDIAVMDGDSDVRRRRSERCCGRIGKDGLLMALVEKKINIIRQVASVVTGSIGAGIKVQDMDVKRRIESEIIGRKFIDHGVGIPGSVGGKKNMGKRAIFGVGRGPHVDVRQTGTIGEGNVVAARGDDTL